MGLKQARLRTDRIEPNDNKTVPIGTMKAVEFVFDELRLGGFLDGFKRCGHSLSSLVKGSVAYKLTENYSVNRCSAWMNDDVIIDLLELEPFNRSALYPVVYKQPFQDLALDDESIWRKVSDPVSCARNKGNPTRNQRY
ncbi:MAG: hypothetical protein ACTSPB_03125 [Candidatus Thorarchaeota archaeon]